MAEDAISAITWIDGDADLQDCRTSVDTLSDQDNNLVDISDLECGEYMSKFDHDTDYVAGDTLSKSILTGKYYFDEHSIKVYKTEKGNFISEDCQSLGLKTNEKNFYWTDKFSYNFKLDSVTKQNILKALKEKINQLENLVSGKQTRLVFNDPGNEFLDDDQYINASKNLLYRLKRRLDNLEGWI